MGSGAALGLHFEDLRLQAVAEEAQDTSGERFWSHLGLSWSRLGGLLGDLGAKKLPRGGSEALKVGPGALKMACQRDQD